MPEWFSTLLGGSRLVRIRLTDRSKFDRASGTFWESDPHTRWEHVGRSLNLEPKSAAARVCLFEAVSERRARGLVFTFPSLTSLRNIWHRRVPISNFPSSTLACSDDCFQTAHRLLIAARTKYLARQFRTTRQFAHETAIGARNEKDLMIFDS